MKITYNKVMLASLLGLVALPSCTSEYDPIKESRHSAFNLVVIRKPVAPKPEVSPAPSPVVVQAPAPTPAPTPVVTPVVEQKTAAPVVVKTVAPSPTPTPVVTPVAAPLPVVKTVSPSVSVSPRQQTPKKVVAPTPAPAPAPTTRQIYVNQYGQQVVQPKSNVVDYPVMPSRSHGGRGNGY